MAVPVQNIYYLLCYAWDWLEARSAIDVDAIQGDRVENLLGQVLRDGVAHLIRQGLDRGYVTFEDEGRRLRGKLVLSETLQRTLLPRGRVMCQLDDFSHDIPHNRVMKAAMKALIGLPTLDPTIRGALRDHCCRMHDVTDVPLSPAAFRCVQLHRNVARYGFLINVCRLIAKSLLADSKTGDKRFHPFTANDQEMGLVFQAFVRNFLRREQDMFTVSSPKVPWDMEPLEGSDPDWLPDMLTDILLTSDSRRVVIETKCYAQPYQSHRGSKKLISDHLYQLLTYLAHLAQTPGPPTTGVLLYAGANENQRLDFRLGAHTVRVRGIDLEQPWQLIHRDLINLAREMDIAPRHESPQKTVGTPQPALG